MVAITRLEVEGGDSLKCVRGEASAGQRHREGWSRGSECGGSAQLAPAPPPPRSAPRSAPRPSAPLRSRAALPPLPPLGHQGRRTGAGGWGARRDRRWGGPASPRVGARGESGSPRHLSGTLSPARLPWIGPAAPGRDAPLGQDPVPVRERAVSSSSSELIYFPWAPVPCPHRSARSTKRAAAASCKAGTRRAPADGTGDQLSGSSLVRIFAFTSGSGDDFRAEFSSSHWLELQNNYDHILILLAGAYCLLVVKDLLSIHQPPIFANYILLK